MPRRPRRLLPAVAVTLVAALFGGALLATVDAAPAQAAVYEGFQKVYSANANGEIVLVGNTLMTCLDGDSNCTAARADAGGTANNNIFAGQFVDVDGNPATFNSSSATLSVPTGGSVLFAALVWGGRTDATAATNSDPALRQNVKLTVPNGSGSTTLDLTGSLARESTATAFGIGYQGYVDVTDTVAAAGSGTYTVANVQSTTADMNRYAGWSLVVALGDPDAPMRNLTVFKGFASLSTGAGSNVQDLTVSGFLTPPAGAVKTTLGAVTYEGDRGILGDSLSLNGRLVGDALNPTNNTFNSTISSGGVQGTGRTPQYNNQLGFDADLITADGYLSNSATSATLTLRTEGDQYFPGVVTFSTELYDPKLYGMKTATLQDDVDGDEQVDVGDTVRYSVALQNIGLDTAEQSTFFDAIPTGTRYVAGSTTIDGVSVTDAAADDRAEFTSLGGNGNGNIVARIGSGAGTTGGDIPTYDTSDSLQDIYTVAFDVVVDRTAVPGQGLVNAASLTYRGKTTLARNASVSNAVVTPLPANPIATNRAPVAKDYVISTTPTTAAPSTTIRPLIDATDPDSDTIRLVGVTDAAGGPVTVNPDGSISYTPRADFAGRDVFTYTLEDAAGNRSTGVIRLDVINAVPTAVDDAQNVSRSGTTPVAVLANDADGNGDALSIRSITANGATAIGSGSVTTTRGGTVTLANGTVRYTPPAGGLAIGTTDSFTYVVQDTRGGSDDAAVTLTARNTVPTAGNDTATTPRGETVDIPVLANDSDLDGDALTVSTVTTPAQGTATINPDGTVRYQPTGTYIGTDSFSYTVSDGRGGSTTATVTVKVNGAPVANSEITTTPGDTAVTLNVLVNDTDPNGDALSVTAVSTAADGSVTFSSTGEVVYSPNPGFVGTDKVTYTVSDGLLTATAVAVFTVSNIAPTARPESATTATDRAVTVAVLDNDSDPNVTAGLQSLSVSTATADHGAQVVINQGGSLTVTPAAGYSGPIAVDYTISDGAGGTSSARLTVTVANAVPVALPDSATTPTGASVLVDILDNDTDANTGSTLTIVSVGDPIDGNGVVRGTTSIEGTRVRFAPAPGWAGPMTLPYTISDGTATADTTVTVTVSNAAPVANADAATAPSGTAVTVDVLGNDTDANIPGTAQQLTVTTATADHGATAAVQSDGRILVTPAAGYRGDVTVDYTISDGAGGTAAGRLTVTVENAAPVATAKSANSRAGRSATIDLLSGDTDANGDTLTVSRLSAPVDANGITRGTVTLVGGVVTFVPDAGFVGTISFDYTISDGNGGTSTETATITLAAAAPTPTGVGGVGTDAGGASPAPAASAPDAAGSLAVTGGSLGAALPLGVLLLLAGAVALLLGRRRSAER